MGGIPQDYQSPNFEYCCFYLLCVCGEWISYSSSKLNSIENNEKRVCCLLHTTYPPFVIFDRPILAVFLLKLSFTKRCKKIGCWTNITMQHEFKNFVPMRKLHFSKGKTNMTLNCVEKVFCSEEQRTKKKNSNRENIYFHWLSVHGLWTKII